MSLTQKLQQQQLTPFQLLLNCRDSHMPKIAATVKKVANGRAVLILGESGTGKEVIARALHEKSDRHQRQLVIVDCTNMRGDTIKSELFGHEAGSFTDAKHQRIGGFEKADKGTIFLDEVGDIPLEEQSRLLRVLNDGSFSRLGSSETRKSDFRLIAATNKDLQGMVANNTFREDLYYRLQMFIINTPPLRERMEDVVRLANHFLSEFTGEVGKKKLNNESEEVLLKHRWRGNVRELKGVIERGILLSGDNEFIGPDDLFLGSLNPQDALLTPEPSKLMESLILSLRSRYPDRPVLDDIEKLAIQTTIEMEGGNFTQTCDTLGMDQATLYRKRKKYGWI